MSLMLVSLGTIKTHAQVGMPTNNPDKNSILDLNRSDGTSEKGLLLPKVALSSTSDPSPLSAHTAGMYVYNTASTGTTGTAVSPGEYYNDGKKWLRVATSSWTTAGNAGTNPASNFVGTNDTAEFAIKTNSTERLRVNADTNIMVGTSTLPTGANYSKLIIDNGTTPGAIQLIDGTQGAGKVLTSDANGVASWAPLTAKTPVKVPRTNIGQVLLPNPGPTGDGQTFYYTGTFITLPPGYWLVDITMLLNRVAAGAGATAANESWQINSTLRDNNTSPTSTGLSPSSDVYFTSNLYAYFPSSSMYSILRGSIGIWNKTAANKTYYYFAGSRNVRNPTGGLMIGSSGASECFITYRQLNPLAY